MAHTIQSFSICLPKDCDAHCPYCISRQTGIVIAAEQEINLKKFIKACELARIGGVTTVLFTGKGEPLLYPELITCYLRAMEEHGYNFPAIEIQTNGLKLARELQEHGPLNDYLVHWVDRLTTISVSVAHFDRIVNKSVFCPANEQYIDLKALNERLHAFGYMTRVNCTMFRGGIDTPKMVKDFIQYAKNCGFDQIVLRPIYSVDDGTVASNWAKEHLLTDVKKAEINGYFSKFLVIRYLAHGAVVYSVDDQNVCLSNCMTREPENREELRQLIYLPEQIVTTEWQYPNAARLF